MSKKLSWLFAMLAAFAMVAAACGSDTVEDTIDAGADAVEEAEDAMDDAEDTMEELSMPGEGVSVTAARANWSTGYFQAAIYSALLTELGYDVSDPADSEFPPSNGYTAMAQGEITFWANSWYPGHLSWHTNELPDGSTVGEKVVILGEELMGSGLEGIMITKTVAEEYGITSMQQLNDDPELVALFDEDGDGKADLFGCPEDWTCDDIMNDMISFNGWDNIAQVKAGYDGMIAESVNRVRAGDPVLQYTWSPSGYLTQLIPGDNTLWLSHGGEDKILDGSTNEAFDFVDSNPAMLGNTCTEDPCWIGWDAADILVTANKEFVDANPAAGALFEAVKLNVIDVADQNVNYTNGQNTEDDVKRHAAEWIADNRDLVDGWLATARAAA